MFVVFMVLNFIFMEFMIISGLMNLDFFFIKFLVRNLVKLEGI